MKYFLLLFLTVSSVVYVNAQAPAIQWAKTYGGIGFDQANSILQTTDGGYIVAGSTNYNPATARILSCGTKVSLCIMASLTKTNFTTKSLKFNL